jgi:Transposase DDE domain
MGVALAPKGVLFLFALGSFKIKALARMADAGADFSSRLNPQTTLLPAKAGGLQPRDRAAWRRTVAGPCVEPPIFLGAQERVACRLVASRVPEPVVNARRRSANKKAKKNGYTPSKAHLTLLAWNLFITNIPHTIWKIAAVLTAYPLRWQIELIFKSWQSYRPLTALKTKKADPPLGYLYGRMLLMLLTYALYPQRRATVWLKQKRALSVLKLVRHFQAWADWWMHALFQSALALRRFLQRAWVTAERLAVKA